MNFRITTFFSAHIAEADAELKHSFVTESHADEEQVTRDQTPDITAAENEHPISRGGGFESADGRLLYRSYIEKALKSKGLRKMLQYSFLLFVR